MRRLGFLLWVAVWAAAPALATWTYQEVNPPGSSSYSIYDSGISWRPQGDYALLAAGPGLYRYAYPSAALTFQAHAGKTLRRVEWAPDGGYALITSPGSDSSSGKIYRYDHAAGGFGTLTEITDIQGSGTYITNFYDVVWNPAAPDEPAYITANRMVNTSSKQMVVYRYDPAASPQVCWDYSGGTSYAAGGSYMSWSPVSVAFQADGDYMLIACRYGLSSQGVHVYDPDQSTFPTSGGAMQYFGYPGDVGNCNTVCFSPVSGRRFALVKGNGRVIRLTQQSTPASFIMDEPTDWHTSVTTAGDSDYSYDGSIAIFLERQVWSPNHLFMTFDADGDGITIAEPITGIPNQTIRLYAVAWHPGQPVGLMAGEDGWIVSYWTDGVPTPAPTPSPTAPPIPTNTPSPTAPPIPTNTPSPTISPTATITPTPTRTATPTRTPTATPVPPIPAAGPAGLGLLALVLGGLVARRRRG